MKTRLPWERQDGETSKAYAMFCAYRDMGTNRSIEKVRISAGRTQGYSRTLLHWSSSQSWESRASAYDDHLDAVRRSGVEKAEQSAAMRKHLQNTREASKVLLEFGMAALKLAQRSVAAYSNLPAEAVQPAEASGLARSALSSLQTALDSEAHSLGVGAALRQLAEDIDG